MRYILACIVVLVATANVFAQSPYAGLESRPVKALSAQQLDDLKAGRGMGFALPAELNGYPGPLHVLELADKLELTADQKTRVESLFAEMRAEAIALGARYVEQEAALERQFATRSATSETLTVATAAAAQAQGALREAHLKYHLSTAALLSPRQIQKYGELRGYAAASHSRQHH